MLDDRRHRAAIVGAGHIGRQHAACLTTMPGVDVAVIDRSSATARAVVEEHSLAAAFTDLNAALRDFRPTAVHVCTPLGSHVALATAALEADAHVLLEKPAATTREEVQQLVDLAEGRGLHLVKDYGYLFDRRVAQLLHDVGVGRLGDLVDVEVAIAVGVIGAGSPFTDVAAPHPSSVLPGGAIGRLRPPPGVDRPRLRRSARAGAGAVGLNRSGAPNLAFDEVRAVISGRSATATVSFSAHIQPDYFRVRVAGTAGRAEADLFEPSLRWWCPRSPRPLTATINAAGHAAAGGRAAVESLARRLGGGPGPYEGVWALVRDFYDAQDSGRKPGITSAQVRAVNELTFAILEQAP